MAEKIIYQNGDITVSNSKVVFGGNSYFLRNIASLRVLKAGNKATQIMLIIGGAMVFGGLANFKEAWFATLIGAGLIYGAYKIGLTVWVLHFDTSSGSVSAYKGKQELMFAIKEKIEEAMTYVEKS